MISVHRGGGELTSWHPGESLCSNNTVVTVILVGVIIVVVRHRDSKQLGEERGCLTYRLQPSVKGSQGRDLEAGTDMESCLAAQFAFFLLFPSLPSPLFLFLFYFLSTRSHYVALGVLKLKLTV